MWFDAHSVKMFENGNPSAIGVYTLPAQAGPGLVVTGQLSGCSFAIRDNGDGTLDATHIRPSQTLQGEALQQTLQATTGWNVVYGRENYSAQHRASIIGVRIAGAWQIYAQTQNANDYGVASVRRLV